MPISLPQESAIIDRPLIEPRDISSATVTKLERFNAVVSATRTESFSRESEQLHLWPEPPSHRIETVILPHKISGEAFSFEINDQGVSLLHGKWSLMGIGKTMLEAELSLHNEAVALAEILLEKPTEELDLEARRLRDFLLNVT